MKLHYDANVYLVGKSTVHDPGVEKFLEDHNITNWQPRTSGATSDGERLPELAGRLCYMSFDKPRPGGNKSYLDHILQVGHGSVLEHSVWSFIFTGVSRSLTHELVRHRIASYCLDGDTEVWSGGRMGNQFSSKKWTMRKLWEMSQDPKRKGRIKLMKVRCFDGEEFVAVGVKSVVQSGVKKLFKLSLSDGKTIRCSADHRFMTPNGWKSVKNLSVGETLATNGRPSLGISREWLKERYHVQGMMVEDIAKEIGCSGAAVRKWIRKHDLTKPVGSGMTGREPWNKGLTYKAGWHHTEETKHHLSLAKMGDKNPMWRGNDATPQAGRLRAQKLFPKKPCEVCGCAEGHRHHKDRNTLNNFLDNIEFLCNCCHKKQHCEEDGKYLHCRPMKIRWFAITAIEPEGEAMTYDLEVDHPAHNFVANGLVTHNSQLSQRYVDESDCEVVVPPELAVEVRAAVALLAERGTPLTETEITRGMNFNNVVLLAAELRAPLRETGGTATDPAHVGLEWLLQALVANFKYRENVEYLLARNLNEEYKKRGPGHMGRTPEEWYALMPNEFKTSLRKAARGTARSVLLNANETKIQVTMNARSWRHFLEMRCSGPAEVEIRKVAYQVHKLLVADSPHLFSDYQEQPLPDGTVALTTAHRKV